MKIFAFAFALAVLSVVSAFAGEVAGRASVIDGDTLDIHGTRIRMQGIDAPESSQTCERDGKPYRCGQQAANFLDGLIAGRPVRCEEETKDKYGRTVARCFVGGTDLNREMVAKGWAVAYRQYSTLYVPDEEQAKSARKGVWAGEFQMPSDFRKAKKGEAPPRPVPAAADKGAGCRVKGNINSKGERIYHVPGSRFYDRTGIDTSAGERWFCSEAEAAAAGWRAPR